MTEETKTKLSNGRLGNQWKKGYRFPLDHPMRKQMATLKGGNKCTFWKGGISTENAKLRRSLDHRTWSQRVFERDDYRCIDCGERGARLNAHHIYPFALHPRLRFFLENGITLCVSCHAKRPKGVMSFV